MAAGTIINIPQALPIYVLTADKTKSLLDNVKNAYNLYGTSGWIGIMFVGYLSSTDPLYISLDGKATCTITIVQHITNDIPRATITLQQFNQQYIAHAGILVNNDQIVITPWY